MRYAGVMVLMGLALGLMVAASTVYASKPVCPSDHPSCGNRGGNDNGVGDVDIEAGNFFFAPQDFTGKPSQESVAAGLVEGKHNLSICRAGSDASLGDFGGVCADGDVVFDVDFNKNNLVINVDFTRPEFDGATFFDFFCSIHGPKKGMVGTIQLK